MNKKDCEVKMVETIERPKMPRATWDALRSHIQRERARKKQEMEQTQEFERLKKERERKKKQEKVTLEDTKEQIASLEARLSKFKEEKHQLFHTLKKVLLEDQSRRRKDPHPSHMYLQPTVRTNPLYMKPHPHLFMPPSVTQTQQLPQQSTSSSPSIPPTKRQRSPSPTRNSLNAGNYIRSYHAGRPPSTSYHPSSSPGGFVAVSSAVNSISNNGASINVISGGGGNSTSSSAVAAAVAAATVAAHYPYTTSARSVVAAAAAQVAAAQAEEDRNKHLYAAASQSAAAAAARSYDRERAALVAAAAAQRLPLNAPPAAHASLTQVKPGFF